MNPSFSFKDNISIANGKFLKFFDTNNTRKDILGFNSGSDILQIKNGGSEIVINGGDNQATYINTNNIEPVIVGSKLGVGFDSTFGIETSLITLEKDNFIGINNTTGYLGLIASPLITSTEGSKVVLNGTGDGRLQFYTGDSGDIEFYSQNVKRLSVAVSGETNFSPDGSSPVLSVTDSSTQFNNDIIVFNSKNATSVADGGSLTLRGGASIEKDLYVGGVLYVDDLSSFQMSSKILATAKLTLTDTSNATSATNGGPLTIAGGASVAKNLVVGGSILHGTSSFKFSGGLRENVDATSSAPVTGLSFNNFLVRSFSAIIAINVQLANFSNKYEEVELRGTKSSSTLSGWAISYARLGDSLNYTFSIEVANDIAQVYYKSSGIVNFQSISINFTVNCVNNVAETVSLPHPIEPASFSLASELEHNALIFTNSTGSAVLTTDGLTFDGAKLEIEGDIIPKTDLAYNLGSPSQQWNDLFLSGNTIHLGPCKLSANVDKTSCSINLSSKSQEITNLYLDGYTYSKLGTLSCSDKRLKSDIHSLQSQKSLETLRKFSPKVYSLKDEPSTKKFGFIAQDVQNIIPSAISKSSVIVPLSVKTGRADGYRIHLDKSLTQNESQEILGKHLKVKSNESNEYNFVCVQDILYNNVCLTDVHYDNPVNIMLVGYIEKQALHVEKDAIYTMGISALQAIDEQLQNEVHEHKMTKVKLTNLEKMVIELCKLLRQS